MRSVHCIGRRFSASSWWYWARTELWMLGNAGNNCVKLIWLINRRYYTTNTPVCFCYRARDNVWQSCNTGHVTRDENPVTRNRASVEGETPAVAAQQQPCQHQQQCGVLVLPTAAITITVRAFIPIHREWWSQWLERQATLMSRMVSLSLSTAMSHSLPPPPFSLWQSRRGWTRLWASGRSRKCFRVSWTVT